MKVEMRRVINVDPVTAQTVDVGRRALLYVESTQGVRLTPQCIDKLIAELRAARAYLETPV